VLKAVTAQMAALGLTSVDTREEFKKVVLDLVNSGALATEAGAKQHAALMNLQQAFATVYPVMEQASESVASATSALTDAYKAEADAIGATINRMGAFATSLRNLRESALLGDLSPLSPQQKYAEAKAQYESVLAAARGGDESAQSNYSAAFNSFLTASRAVFASGADYQNDFAYAQASTAEAERWASAQVDVGTAQLDALKSSVTGLITLDKSVLSVRDAILQLHQAMGTAAPAPGVLTAPQVSTPAPVMYASYGADNTVALVAELKSVRQELASLRAEQAVQTGHVIEANARAARESAEHVAGATTTGFKSVTNSEQRVALA
jgi:polyhydroxyalkanoate synthesis regulator phasin